MSPIKVTLLLFSSMTLAAVAGGAAGYYAALTTPAVSNVAVLDIEALTKSVDVTNPAFMQRSEELALRTKAVADRLTAAGMVVLDRAYVIAAPEQAVIRVDTKD